MFDGNARQSLGQLRPPVFVLDAPGLERLAGFLFYGGLVHRQRIHDQPEQEQLAGIEAFGVGAVEAAEQGVEVRFVLLLERRDGVGGFALDLFDHRVTRGDVLITGRGRRGALEAFLHQQLLQEGGIIGKCVGRIHAPSKTHNHGKSCGVHGKISHFFQRSSSRRQFHSRQQPHQLVLEMATDFSSDDGNWKVPRSSRL